MDFGGIGGTVVVVVLMVLLVAANMFLRFRRGENTPLGMAVSLLSAVNKNIKLVENFKFHWQSKKFKTGEWEGNKTKLHFLPQELLTTLSHTFAMVEGFNEKMDAARKYKSDSYMASVDVDKLKAPLAESKQELEEWLQVNIRNPEMHPKRRGLFSGGLFR